jgi:hypothetical protein
MGIAAGMKDIVQDIVSSYDARVADVGRLKKETEEMLDSFKASQDKMGAQLRKDLAQDKAKMRGAVRTMRNNFQASHKKMGVELKKELIQGVTARRSEVKEMRHDFGKVRAEVRADLNEAAAAWKGLAKTTPAKRARVKVPPKAKVPIAKEKIAEELPDLEAKLLAAINEHLNGITLTGVADSLGVVPIVLGRAARSLLDKGKVRKEDKLYFPVRPG